MEQHEFDQVTSSAATKDLFGDPERALTVYARAVLGVNPEEMGSPYWAGGTLPVDQSAGNVYGPARLQPTREGTMIRGDVQAHPSKFQVRVHGDVRTTNFLSR